MACEQLVRRKGVLEECGRPCPVSLQYPGRMCERCENKWFKRGERSLLEWEEFRAEKKSRKARKRR